VLGSPGYHEYVVLPEDDRRLCSVRVTQGDVEPPVKNQEELVGVVVDVPDVPGCPRRTPP
jgi:hypothetical protein